MDRPPSSPGAAPDLLELPRPLPAVARPIGRLLLRTWSRFPKAPGYLYHAVEKWGARLAVKPMKCRLSTGAAVTVDLREHVQRHMYFFGAYEPIESYLFKRLLRPGMIVVDAGANVGQYTLVAAAAVGPEGQVHSFEPVQSNFTKLTDHVVSNGLAHIVRLNSAALWDENGPLDLHYRSDVQQNAGTYSAASRGDAVGSVSCRALRLDDYVIEQQLPRLDVIKMDIEGAELRALEGAARTVSRWRPTIQMEITRWASRANGYEPERLWEFLKPYGYRMWATTSSPRTSHELLSLDGVESLNVIFHVDPLPEALLGGWSQKGILRASRRGSV